MRRAADDDDALTADIARQIVDQRAARQLSQAELANLCGTTQSAIARLERGARPPRLDTLARIATALDCALVVRLEPRTRTRRAPAGPSTGPAAGSSTDSSTASGDTTP